MARHAGVTSGSAHHRRMLARVAALRAWAPRLPRPGLVTRFVLIGAAVGLLIASALAWYVEARVADLLLEEVTNRAVDEASLAVQPRVTRRDFEPPFTTARLADLAARLDPLLARERQRGLLRLHLFSADGTIVYSDVPEKRGEKEDLDEAQNLAAALGGQVRREISALDSPENADLRAQYDSALEVYVPLVIDGEVVGAYEIYQDLAPLRPVRPLVWSAVLGGFALLLLALLLVVRGAAALIRRQRAQVDAQEARYRMLVEHLPVISYTAALEPGHRIQYISPQVEPLLGYLPDEVTARPTLWVERLHPDDRERVLAELRHRHERGEAHRLEYRLLHRDGRARWFRDEGGVVPDAASGRALAQGVLIDITERKAVEEALEHQALYDALTGLPNRTLLRDRLRQSLLAAQREGRSAALLVMDLDGFKEVNDALGHATGDVLLRAVSERLRAALRASDTVARLGGDEFAALLPLTDTSGAAVAAANLQRALEAPFPLQGHAVSVSASIGIAVYPEHADDVDTLLRCADVAMYAAKRSGGGYAVYAVEQDQHSVDRLALIAELRQAIERDQLTLHFQPRADLRSGTVVGVEALVRWQHPQRGLIPPDQFIPLAEQTGLIKPLSQWVLGAALRQIRAWLDEGLAIPVAVNLSMRDLHDPRLPDIVEELLRAWQTSAEWLRLEITESAVMADPQRALETVERLRRLGVEIAIDDFGTGYSSLSYLKRLPVQELKIDRSFVRDVARDENDRAIVQATVQLAHALGLRVVAEGVEDAPSLDLLARLGCDEAQGYYLGRPGPATRVAELAATPLPAMASPPPSG